MPLVDRTCQYCGRIFVARSIDVTRGWALFCSKSCKAFKQGKDRRSRLKPEQARLSPEEIEDVRAVIEHLSPVKRQEVSESEGMA